MAPKRYLITLSTNATHLSVSGVPTGASQQLLDGLRAAYVPRPPMTASATFDELEAKILALLDPALDVRCTSGVGEDSFSFDDIDVRDGGT